MVPIMTNLTVTLTSVLLLLAAVLVSSAMYELASTAFHGVLLLEGNT